ncbi:MAG: hypothetical protein ACYSW3_00040 [Planctomycetota bacterium]
MPGCQVQQNRLASDQASYASAKLGESKRTWSALASQSQSFAVSWV